MILKKQVRAQENSPESDRGRFESKRSELQSNVEANKAAQLSYDANFDHYVDVDGFHPDSKPGKSPNEFLPGTVEWTTIGWQPDGQVRGDYKVTSTSSKDLIVKDIDDVQSDQTQSSWTANKTVNTTMNTRNDVY